MFYLLLDTRENALVRRNADLYSGKRLYTRDGKAAMTFDDLASAANTINELKHNLLVNAYSDGEWVEHLQIISCQSSDVKFLKEMFS